MSRPWLTPCASPPSLTVDDATIKTIADSAAEASAAVRDALSQHLPLSLALSALPALPATSDLHAATDINSTVPPAASPILPEVAALLARLSGSLPAPPNDAAALNNTSALPLQVLDADACHTLHAYAVVVLNVKDLIPVTLELATAKLLSMARPVLVILGKYALTDLVVSDVPLLDQVDLTQMECVDLLQEVMSPTATAHTVWHDLEFKFLGNCELCAVNLSAEYHTFQKGDLSVTEYCRRLRTMADYLIDLGEPQSECTLVLTLINGLSPKYSNLQYLLPMQVLFPSFLQARSQLLLEEITKGHCPTSDPTMAFAASTTGASVNTSSNTGNGGSANGGGNRCGNSRNSRNRPIVILQVG
uniref:Uncharacterized protein n=1 Tax=Oryza brachyantha TaxID=4533 RepID=J3LVP1_ORYBR